MRGSKCCAAVLRPEPATAPLNEGTQKVLNHPGIRLLAASLLVFGGLWLHELVQVLARPAIVTSSPLERAIPFLPWTIWIYFSFFALIGATALLVRPERFLRFVFSATLAALIAWTVVLLLPITFERPDPSLISGALHRAIYDFVHAVDPAHITFPSLHVAVTWICVFMLWGRSHQHWLFVLGAAISLSTLLTKQHQVADVAGGMALATLCVWVTGRKWW